MKDIYKELSKEQLVYLIEQFEHSSFIIGEICVDASKDELDSYEAVRQIRKNIFYIPHIMTIENLSAWVDHERGVISNEEYRKLILGEED